MKPCKCSTPKMVAKALQHLRKQKGRNWRRQSTRKIGDKRFKCKERDLRKKPTFHWLEARGLASLELYIGMLPSWWDYKGEWKDDKANNNWWIWAQKKGVSTWMGLSLGLWVGCSLPYYDDSLFLEHVWSHWIVPSKGLEPLKQQWMTKDILWWPIAGLVESGDVLWTCVSIAVAVLASITQTQRTLQLLIQVLSFFSVGW